MPVKRSDRAKPSKTDSSGRIYQEGRMWYFATREQTVEGPYRSAAAAEAHLDDYLMMVCAGLVPPGGTELAEREAVQTEIE